MERSDDLVLLQLPRGAQRELLGEQWALVGDRRYAEPHEEDECPRADEPLAERGLLDPHPQRPWTEPRPHLRAPKRRQGPDRQGPSGAAGDRLIDRAEAQRDDHRVRLEAEDEVRVVLDPQERKAGEHGGDDRRAPVPILDAHQLIGDPPGEDHAAQRDRYRRDHPQPQLVVAEQRVGHREEVRERLPRGGAAQVEAQMPGLIAPDEPAVRVVSGPGVGHPDEGRREQHERDPDDPPRVLAKHAPRPRTRARQRAHVRQGRAFRAR